MQRGVLRGRGGQGRSISPPSSLASPPGGTASGGQRRYAARAQRRTDRGGRRPGPRQGLRRRPRKPHATRDGGVDARVTSPGASSRTAPGASTSRSAAGARSSASIPRRASCWRAVPVCAAPRGLAYDAAADLVHVACAGGELVSLPAAGGAATRTLRLDSDLRDVVVDGWRLRVSRFRSAELLTVEANGTVSGRVVPPGFADLSARSSQLFTAERRVADHGAAGRRRDDAAPAGRQSTRSCLRRAATGAPTPAHRSCTRRSRPWPPTAACGQAPRWPDWSWRSTPPSRPTARASRSCRWATPPTCRQVADRTMTPRACS